MDHAARMESRLDNVPSLKLFFIVADDENNDAFVRTMTAADAVKHWKDYHRGKYDEDVELTVVEVPVNFSGIGVVPWDTINTEEIEP